MEYIRIFETQAEMDAFKPGHDTLAANKENSKVKVCTSGLTCMANSAYSRWATGDYVYINDYQTPNTVSASGTSYKIIEYTAESPYNSLYSNYELTGYVDGTYSFVIPLNEIYSEDASGSQRINAPMYSHSTSNRLQFNNALGLMKFDLPYADSAYPILEYVEVQSNSNISGAASVNVQSGTFQMASSNVFGMRRMIVNRTLTNSAKPFCVPIPPCQDQFVIRFGFRSANGDKAIYEKTTETLSISANITVEPFSDCYQGSTVYYGLLSGQFDVSASSKVRFAQGNLRYTTTGTHSVAGGDSYTGTFALSNHQYDFIGSDNANISSGYTGWIDLFGWGTSGWESGATCYQPWSTTATSSSYYPGGSTGGNNCLTGDYANADWGVYNAISNAGNTSGYLRCFTYNEYNYLKANNSGIAQGQIIVNNNVINGMIILPNVWSLPQGCSFTNGKASGFNTNSYTEAQWQLMESAGAVFFPTAGYRSNTSIKNTNSDGYYWSSTSTNSVSGTGTTSDLKSAKFVAISDFQTSDRMKYLGSSVRLVKPMN